MLRLKVSGMKCGHCSAAVSNVVRAVPAVQSVSVDLARGEVMVSGTPDEQAVRQAIAQRGYEVQAATWT